MKKSQFFLTASLAAVIAFTSLSVIASADEPMQQNREEVKTAVESGDYNAFAEVAPDFLLEKITPENFNRFQEMHNHTKQARAIAEELGLERMGQMKGKMKQNHEEVKAAIASGDYNAFAEIAPGKMLEHINADNFGQFQEMHNALENKDFETAKKIAEGLGLPERPQGQKSMGQKGLRFKR